MEWCSLEDLYSAYVDCRHRKRTSNACAEFEMNEVENLYLLYEDLNNGTYEIGKSIAFCISRPKVREVFAADFRDRIVHHLLIQKTGDLFEKYFIDNTFNCRVGKGTSAGHYEAQRLAHKYKDGWVLCCDIKSFFMSIPKEELADRLEKFLRVNYLGTDIEEVIKLTRQVALHAPLNFCLLKGNLKLWDLLSEDKSLFTCKKGLGMAIGNLTSLIYANFYLSLFDHWMDDNKLIRYCRYVDDFRVFAHKKQTLLELIPKIREYLKINDLLLLHPSKVSLQPTHRGFNFIGATIKGSRLYIGKRTAGNSYNLVRKYNYLTEKQMKLNIDRFVARYNSYMGFMKYYNTYNIRTKVWFTINKEFKQYFTINLNYLVIKARPEYRYITQLKLQYKTKLIW